MAAANQLAHQLEGRRLNYGTNLPFGNLRLVFNHQELDERGYRRELDLDEGVARVQYQVGSGEYQREMFISAPDQVLVIRLTCSQPGALTFRVILDGDEQPFSVHSAGDDTLLMDTRALETIHSSGQVGVAGHARLHVQIEEGWIDATGSQLAINQANAVTILAAMGTSFGGNDPVTLCQEKLLAASQVPYQELRDRHVAELGTRLKRRFRLIFRGFKHNMHRDRRDGFPAVYSFFLLLDDKFIYA